MKPFFILTFLIALLPLSKAQNAFQKNNQTMTLGYGVPNIFKSILTQQFQSEDASLKAALIKQGSSFTYSSTGIGPLFLKYEYAVSSRIGLGLAIAYINTSVTEKYGYQRFYSDPQSQINQQRYFYQAITRSSKSISIGGRFNYHFGERSRIDPYVGFAIGYNHAVMKESYTTDDPDLQPLEDVPGYLPIPVYVGATMGLRAYLTKNIGFYLEMGFDKWSLIQGGLAFKLP